MSYVCVWGWHIPHVRVKVSNLHGLLLSWWKSFPGRYLSSTFLLTGMRKSAWMQSESFSSIHSSKNKIIMRAFHVYIHCICDGMRVCVEAAWKSCGKFTAKFKTWLGKAWKLARMAKFSTRQFMLWTNFFVYDIKT